MSKTNWKSVLTYLMSEISYMNYNGVNKTPIERDYFTLW